MSVFTTALKHTSDHNFSLILIECDWNQHAALCIAYSKVQQRPGNPDSPCQVTRNSSGLWCHYLGSASAPMLRAQGFELSCPGMVSGQCWAQQQPFWDPKAVGSPRSIHLTPWSDFSKIMFATLLPLITNLIKWKTVTLFDAVTSQYIRCLSSSSGVWNKRVTQPSLIKSFWSRSLLPAKGVCEAISFSEITEKIPRSS